jgi:homoaconitase/3-isopropylmalate dehydratase large subunit
MKMFLGMMVLFSTAANACPNLNGNFTCQKGSTVFNLAIEGTSRSYIINRDGNEFEYMLDGKSHDVPSTDSYQDAKVVSTCEDDKLVVGFEANILYEGSVIAHQVSKSYYYNEGNNIVLLQKVKMKGIPLPTNKFSCVRN